jgi:23S rRNA pseudouridine1911/1915/1917 synthase
MRILDADDARIYLWKPPGVPVFPPHADPRGDCVLARWIALDPSRADGWPDGFGGGIAHRLDTATSGLLVAARTVRDLAPLREQFAARALRKHYLFASAAPAPGLDWPHRVETEIAHHPNRRDRMVWRRGPRTAHRGKWYPAWSSFRPGPVEGRWHCEIRTGVMHQVRVHAASIGLPLTGDPLYGGAEGRYMLHAWRIDGPGWRSPEAPLPDPEDPPDGLVRPPPR